MDQPLERCQANCLPGVDQPPWHGIQARPEYLDQVSPRIDRKRDDEGFDRAVFEAAGARARAATVLIGVGGPMGDVVEVAG